MRLIQTFRGVVHYADGAKVLASRGRSIFESSDGGQTWRSIARLPVALQWRAGAATRLGQRLMRAHVYHLQPNSDGSLIALGFGSVFGVETDGHVHRLGAIHGSRPLTFCESAGTLYYGEYRGNTERTPIHIWTSDDQGRTWTSCHAFNAVRHVHGVFADPYADAIWVTTGDTDAESAIWVTRDRFATLEKAVAGSQQARVVTLLFTADAVFYGSDTPLETNYLYRLDRGTGSVTRLAEVNGPVFHGTAVGDHLLFSTVCEPTHVLRSMHATVWSGTAGGEWRPVQSFTKDGWPMRLFQYGQVLFPAGPGERGYAWMTPFATSEDQVSRKLVLERS